MRAAASAATPAAPATVPAAAPRRRPASAAALLLAASLAGCAGFAARTADPVDPPAAIALPPAWSAPSGAGGQPVDARWWTGFGDPVLDALQQRALQANTRIDSARAALRQARALRDVAAAGLQPTLGGSASAQRGSAGGRSTGNRLQAGVDASWELDLFGARRSALDSSQASAEASAASLGTVQLAIGAELALAYIGLRSDQARSAIASANLASQQQTLQLTDWRLQAGLVTALEADQARAAAEQTAALLPPLATSIAQNRHALAVLTGQPPAAAEPAALLDRAAPVPLLALGPDLAIPAEVLRQRPDVRAAERQVAAALADLAQADAARRPSFSLGGTLGLSAATLAALGSGTAVVGTLLAGVTLPILDGGAGLARVRAQQAALDQAQAGYRATLLSALQEVEDALVALAGDRSRLASLQRAASAAAGAALLARQRYGSGLVDFQTVLETQRTQLGTEDGVAVAGAGLAADQVRLVKALGGGWRADADRSAAAGDAPLPALSPLPRLSPIPPTSAPARP